ncbi:MAG: radical SAM protein [Patescibacteria group bacterium]
MKIALIDSVHLTRGGHSNTVPLGIGLLATYLIKNILGELDIKLFKNPNEISDVLKNADWVPDVVGISQYSWNSQLNLYFASLAKKNNPKCLVVAGGPNLESSPKARAEYLKINNFVDLAVAYDGEIPLLNIVKRFMTGESASDLRRNPPAGVFSVHPDTLEYTLSSAPAPRLDSINVFGAIYASGILDKFLVAGYHPLMETVRGCPFNCAFCHASDIYNSRLLFLSPEFFKADMEYIGKRLAGQSDIFLFFSNSNMGFYNEDMEMARIVRDSQKKYNWPKYINLSTGKDPQKLLEMLSIVDFEPGIAIQTLTPEVLKNICRRNIPLEEYTNFQKKVLSQRGDTTATELILNLPGETKETFLKTLSQVINSGVQTVVVLTLMKLAGTPLAAEEKAREFQYVVRHRVVPRQFSDIDGKKILDTEEVIVGTKDMSFEDYIDLRGLCFVIAAFFSSAELLPLKKFLLEVGADLFEWVLNIHQNIKSYHDINAQYENFIKETREELFASREELLKFYEQEDNFSALLKGEKGDNLLRKYKYELLSKRFSSCLALAIKGAEALLVVHQNSQEFDKMLKDLEKFLSTRDLRVFFEKNNIEKTVSLKYDIPNWSRGTNEEVRPLSDFAGSVEYAVSFTVEQEAMFSKLKDDNKDSDLSWQIIYRDGYTKDLWPVWTRL